MAPIRVTKRVTRKAPLQRDTTDSWELLEREPSPEQTAATIPVQEPANIAEALDPLRQMADRVGREVETFAERVDRFFTDLPTVTNRFDAAHDLVLHFRDIAVTEVQDLKLKYERDMREQLRKEWSEQAHTPAASTASLDIFTASGSASLSAKKAGNVQLLRLWQQEAGIWELFRVMLELHPFPEDAHTMNTEKEEQLARMGPVHRYTSDGDLWERFLLEDNLAKERHIIKNWLEQTVDHQFSDVQTIVEELEAKAGRGKGLWSSGWMHTREKIKGEKRLRNWPDEPDSSLPELRRSDNNELLVTSLDPDAPQRQNRTLEKPDAYFERATWVACWEMLRRGIPLHEICDWCEDRKEGWRAVIMGAASDVSESTSGSAAWRHICFLASQSSGCSDYEAAVLGSIGGNVKAMEAVAHSIDDHLYAHYSAALTRQFDHYLLETRPDRIPSFSRSRQTLSDSTLDPQQAQLAIGDLIHKLKKNASTKNESGQPMKIIQGFLLADEVGSLIASVGAAIAETEELQGSEGLIVPRDAEEKRDELEVALNKQTLRITTHMAIVHRVLSPEYLSGEELLEDENVLVAYIQTLRDARKRLLVPVYASKLRKERQAEVLARVLQDITESQEQARMLRLLRELDLDVDAIFNEQLSWILDTTFDSNYADMPLPILESTTEWKMYPGERIQVNFLPDVVTPSDDAVVRALQWFQLLPGEWNILFGALALALRKCLVTGRLVCARMIVQNFPFRDICRQKSYEVLGKTVNFFEDDLSLDVDEEEVQLVSSMRTHSRTYWELEQLVTAIEKLSAWRSEEHRYMETAHNTTSGVPLIIKQAKGEASRAIQPLLHGIFQHPINNAEAEDLAHIRLTYLPEVIIAYATVLHAAGNLITRESLLESMDLSVLIATGKDETADPEDENEDNGLLECFTKTGRMRELMSVFALTSKLMLVLKAEGRPWRPKKDRVGRELGMWELARAGENAE